MNLTANLCEPKSLTESMGTSEMVKASLGLKLNFFGLKKPPRPLNQRTYFFTQLFQIDFVQVELRVTKL